MPAPSPAQKTIDIHRQKQGIHPWTVVMSGLIITQPGPIQPSAAHNSTLMDDDDEEQLGSVYHIKESQEIGRFLVASRNLCAGQVIIDDEEPLVVGPKQATYPVCLTCYRRVDGSYLCPNCRWPLCSELCHPSENGRHQIECQILAEHQAFPSPDELSLEDCKIYDCIAPLRIVLENQENAEKSRLWTTLEDHRHHRQLAGIWHVDQITVVDPIRIQWDLGDYIDEEELQRACGILEVNAFEVCDEDEAINARAVYSISCLMAHDCVPNTACSVDPATQRMTVRAAVDIPAGQMITTSYTFTLDGTQRRRTHLKETKFFDCHCHRCRDPTELGTHLSSLACPKCNGQQFTVPEDPLNPGSYWRCLDDRCRYRIGSTQVQQLLDCLQRKADALNYDDISGLESFVESWSPILHPNHSILIGIKYYLCHFYGNAPGFLLDEMPPHLLERKIKLCQELLQIAHILEPGASKFRGGLVRELESAQSKLARGSSPDSDSSPMPSATKQTEESQV